MIGGTGAFSLYGTTELIIVQQHLPEFPDGFWKNLFKRTVTSDRQEILFERIDIPNRRLAPFVAPNVQGRVMREQGFSARSFTPAYVKPKHVVDPTKAITRIFGEALLGGLTMGQRFDYHVVNNMRLERESIERRWDWMAARAVIDGMVTVSGDDYPTQTIDFLRDPSLTTTLLTTARWDQLATADPLADLSAAADNAFALGYAPITDIVFGTYAWAQFIKNAQVLFLLNQFYRGSSADFSRGELVPHTNFQRMGTIGGPSGSFTLWRYNNIYNDTDSNGNLTLQYFLDPKQVCGYGEALEGVGAFGAIMDVDADFLAEATMFPKMWKEEDPSVLYTMTQSAPLFIPTNPNNSFKITVAS